MPNRRSRPKAEPPSENAKANSQAEKLQLFEAPAAEPLFEAKAAEPPPGV
jgi:hypothetical protein